MNVFPGLGMQEALIILAILIIITFHILMIVHVLCRKQFSIMRKALWILVIVFIPIVGPGIYRLSAYHDTQNATR